MKKLLPLIAVVAIIAILIVCWGQYGNYSAEQMKNVDMMSAGNTSEVIAHPDLAYFPGAKGYFVRPVTEAVYPGVVMIHENRGLRPEIKQAADALAKEGYTLNNKVDTRYLVENILGRFRLFMSDQQLTNKMIRDLKLIRANKE